MPAKHLIVKQETLFRQGELCWLPTNAAHKPKWKGVSFMGLSIEEMIFTGVLVGGFGMFAAFSVPWDELRYGAPSPLMHQLTDIEKANALFHHYQNRWPFQMTDGSPAHNAAALVTTMALRYPYNNKVSYRAYLKDVPFDLNNNKISLRHSFGAGGRIVQEPSDNPAYALKVTFEQVPLHTVQELDVSMDRHANLNAGRVQAKMTHDRTDMIFYANPVRIQTASR